MFDLLIRAPTVVDGTGSAAYRADVAVEAGRIVEIGPRLAGRARRRLDADGLVLAPGFIDLHAHSDLSLLHRPEHELKVRMGVTTELLGQDGLSYAPATPAALLEMRDLIAAINGAPDIAYDWTSVAGYLDRVEQARPAVNVAYLVPHGMLRLSVMGMDDRPATAGEAERMAAMAAAGMADGALGLSTGLTYPPARASETAEIITVARAVAARRGLYVTHHRDYAAGLVDAVGEAIRIGREAGLPVHFSHFHVAGEYAGRADAILELLETARRAGQDISLDAYPYLAASTFLGAFLPDLAQGGSAEDIVARLQRPELRRRVVASLDVEPWQFLPATWDQFVISSVGQPGPEPLEGRRLLELAAVRRCSIGELVCDLLVEQRMQVAVVVHVGDEANVRTIMGDPAYMVGTDAILEGSALHPRAGGTYPRILGTYVRDEGVIGLERAVRAMSGAAADRLGLVDRGYVRPGQHADLVLFDPLAVAGPASYEEPELAPQGLPYVFVGGEAVKWDDALTGARPGRVIRGDGRGEAR